MKKSFETYLALIENELDVKLLRWQKAVLESIYNGYCPHISCVRGGKTVMGWAAELLAEEIYRDEVCLPPRLYELDGYKTDMVIYDELEKENKL